MLEVIKSSTDISRAFKEGRRIGRPPSTLIVLKQDGQHDQNGRVAFVAGKKNGNAVWRNKAKRRLRSICRELGGAWSGYDVIFVASRATTDKPYSKVLGEYRKLLEKNGIR